jgi:hypothetical protein
VTAGVDRGDERPERSGVECRHRAAGILGVPNRDHSGQPGHFDAVIAALATTAALAPVQSWKIQHVHVKSSCDFMIIRVDSGADLIKAPRLAARPDLSVPDLSVPDYSVPGSTDGRPLNQCG